MILKFNVYFDTEFGQYVAICDAYDIVVQGDNPDQLKEKVQTAIYGHSAICQKYNQEPLECVRYTEEEPLELPSSQILEKWKYVVEFDSDKLVTKFALVKNS